MRWISESILITIRDFFLCRRLFALSCFLGCLRIELCATANLRCRLFPPGDLLVPIDSMREIPGIIALIPSTVALRKPSRGGKDAGGGDPSPDSRALTATMSLSSGMLVSRLGTLDWPGRIALNPSAVALRKPSGFFGGGKDAGGGDPSPDSKAPPKATMTLSPGRLSSPPEPLAWPGSFLVPVSLDCEPPPSPKKSALTSSTVGLRTPRSIDRGFGDPCGGSAYTSSSPPSTSPRRLFSCLGVLVRLASPKPEATHARAVEGLRLSTDGDCGSSPSFDIMEDLPPTSNWFAIDTGERANPNLSGGGRSPKMNMSRRVSFSSFSSSPAALPGCLLQLCAAAGVLAASDVGFFWLEA
mmetsp:Transcript_33506/g.94837  ORF Transcript_33506/g.94837 Transcript_33506/m.94837 type:complete len:356 (-) Transcript_33506:1417-2484(-)